jgi:RNA polymerase sigma-70 factor (ECF subfamily)
VASTAAVEEVASADDALIQRAQGGDAAAFDVLVASRLDRCCRLASSILLNDADAADAVQDAFVAAWRELRRLRDVRTFDGWLNRIVANAALMARRHRLRLREVNIVSRWSADDGFGQIDPPWDPCARTDLDGLHDGDQIGHALRRLRPQDRAILVFHHVEERPVAEIARGLGIPVGTAKWRLHAARRALLRAMEAEA